MKEYDLMGSKTPKPPKLPVKRQENQFKKHIKKSGKRGEKK